MADHPAPTCPEGVNQCEIDCPRYGRDCDGDELVYVTGGVGDDGPADWLSPLNHCTRSLLKKYVIASCWTMGPVWLMWQMGWVEPDEDAAPEQIIDGYYGLFDCEDTDD